MSALIYIPTNSTQSFTFLYILEWVFFLNPFAFEMVREMILGTIIYLF